MMSQPKYLLLCYLILMLTLNAVERWEVSKRDVPQHGSALPELPKSKCNPKDGVEIVFIPAGEFLMGDKDVFDNPPRKVYLSDYWIYKHLVTVKQYRAFCRSTHREMPGSEFYDREWQQENCPISNITWEEAMAYAKWAGGTLPTEAQWEKAARGTDGRKYPWGNQFDLSKVWGSTEKNIVEGPTEVGKYGISPYGLSDMAGNLWQWCLDWYDRDFGKGKNASLRDPLNRKKGKASHALRGGSWRMWGAEIFLTARRYAIPYWANIDTGFRVVIPATKSKESTASCTESDYPRE